MKKNLLYMFTLCLHSMLHNVQTEWKRNYFWHEKKKKRKLASVLYLHLSLKRNVVNLGYNSNNNNNNNNNNSNKENDGFIDLQTTILGKSVFYVI